MSAPSCSRRRRAARRARGAQRTLLDRLCELYPEHGRRHWYAAVACGEVLVDGERVRDPQRPIKPAAAVGRVAEPPLVSRAGYKLRHALIRFGAEVAGKVVLDAGAAAGGFTDCLLRHGARHVHCVDVAHGALAYRLRRDRRTSVHERTNVMHLAGGSLQPPPDGAVCDLSFRSLRGAAARLLGLTRENWLIALIKPQFELAPQAEQAGRARFDGRVVGADAIAAAVAALLRDLAAEGVAVRRCAPAPVRGRRGNREVLALLAGGGAAPGVGAAWPAAVAALHRELQQLPERAAADYGAGGPAATAARLSGSPM